MRKLLYLVFFGWVLLLAASTAFRAYCGFERHPLPDQIVVSILGKDTFAADGPVTLAYRDLNTADSTGAPFLLLHGNPMAGRAMLPLANELPKDRRILIPDLPGLGFSSRNITEFSAENHVTLLLEWLEQLNVRQVHVVGYSQGSAVALELVDRAPKLVESVTLIAGVGLQEHELLGRYEWNQPIYSLYHGLLVSARWLIPHFGFLDAPAFAPSTALNFAHTDLRRNERILQSFEQPTLILHSVQDRLVPFSAAQAHAELVPQAVFMEMRGGHLGLFTDTASYADELVAFIDRVESGTALTRLDTLTQGRADQPAALLELPEDVLFMQSLMLGSLLCLLVFFSEDLSCIAGGILAAGGAMSLSAAIIGCFFGIWISDVLLYVLGYVLGSKALHLSFISKASKGGGFVRFRQAYASKGARIVFITRFVPGSRVIAYVTAGVLKIGLPRFALWLALAAGIWTPILVSIAYVAGRPLIQWWEHSGLIVLPLMALCILGLYVFFCVAIKATTHRGRCSLRGRWIRLTQWEFWPALPVYLPVLAYNCWLALRYRSLTVWAACNPGMSPASGLAMESKSQILASLNEASGKVATWCSIEISDTVESQLETLRSFQETLDRAWPIILKPDIGQRGEGVAVIRDEAQARNYLEATGERVIAQKYISGEEFGVFYYRFPHETTGHLFSITEKVLPSLIGDGKSTIEALILHDSRAVALAKHYLRVNAERLTEVPELGASFQLVELGTHCRGAIFLDGNRYQSDQLRAALDEVLSTYGGFFFGRFDLRVPSGAALTAGKDFSILELNGVSSESTDIYDPKNSVFTAWRVLCRQWQLAFEIGAANRARGAKVPSLREVLAVLRGHRQRDPFEAPIGAEVN
jgi:pimeloyl-ACP methyl ester carboxylesterase/membrane protein DedA with SNARE-associated domain